MAERAEDKGPDFEKSLEEVQHIIDAIEGGQVTLEKSIEQYARGMQLISRCRQLLDRAESRIKQLTVDEQGNLKEAGEMHEESAEE